MSKTLEELRSELDELDNQLLDLLVSRMTVSKQVGALKKQEGLPVLDKEREIELIERLRKNALEKGLNTQFVSVLYELIMDQSKKEQE